MDEPILHPNKSYPAHKWKNIFLLKNYFSGEVHKIPVNYLTQLEQP